MKVVTICGSMKFKNDMIKIASDLEKDNGYSVIQCVYDIDPKTMPDVQLQRIKDAHYKHIDLADAIYVVNINGYIGSSTMNEIEYAKKTGKEIMYHVK